MGLFDKLSNKFGLSNNDEDLLDEENEDNEPSPEIASRKEEPKEMQQMQENEMEFGGRNEPSHSNVVDFMSRNPKVQEAVAGFKVKVVVVEPKSFDDAQQVANCLREKRPVVLNFEKTEREVARRILDFISGTIYAISGAVSRVGNNVFLCAPNNVNVSYTEDGKRGSTDMPWMNKR